MIKRFTLFFLFFITVSSFGLDLCFTNYNSRNGLPSSQVYDMFQDKNGDMWFATDRGIVKYDGFNFKVFDVSTGLPSNTIFDFFPQKNGTVWCSTINNSWFYFQDGTEQFKKPKFSDTLQKYSNNFQSDELIIADNGHIYVGFEDANGFLEIDQYGRVINKIRMGVLGKPDAKCLEMKLGKDFFHFYLQDLNDVINNKYKHLNTISAPNKNAGYQKSARFNGCFVYTTNTALYLKKDNQATKEYDLGQQIIGVGSYDTKHIWVGFKGDGIRIYDMNMREKAHYLFSNYVTDLFRDKHGGIWISTLFNGVYYAMNDKIEKINSDREFYVYQLSQGINGEIAIVENNGIYFSLNNNKLIQKEFTRPNSIKVIYDVKTQTFVHSITSFNAGVLDVTENTNRTALVGTRIALFLQNTNGTFSRFDISQKLNCSEFARNGFYFGTNNGLYFLDTLRNKEIKLTHPDFHYRITDIKLIDGYHFIGTSGNGVIRYNEATGKIEKVTKHDGLTNNIVNELFAESKCCVWVATNNGLNKLTFKNGKYQVLTLTEENGLPNDEITDIIKVGNILWVGTTTGLIKMKASEVAFSNRNLNLNLFWENFKLNGIEIPKSALKNISYDVRNIKFNFHLSYFGGLENVDIRYKLVGQDSNWVYIKRHEILFNYLEPGNYKLIIQARAENGEWKYNELAIDFVVHPPFYATWWFILLSISTIILLIYWFFKVRILIYNRDFVRELLRLIIRKIKPQTNSFIIWSQGKEIRISSDEVLFFKSEGNYLMIITAEKKYMFRYKIGDVNTLVPDKLEYLQVHRSYVVRLDKISGKGVETIDIQGYIIPIGKTYRESVRNLIL